MAALEKPLLYQCSADGNAERVVDRQNLNGHASDRCSAHQVDALPTEMTRPFVPSRIEKGDKHRSRAAPLHSRQIRPLMPIAVQARIGEVA